MAQRRMFSPQIVDSDAFLDMSVSAQALYFHLGMRADDDGFVGNPKKILRMLGSNDDDFKILLAKRFLLSFESGVVVIKHWRIHNLIRSDRYNETKYLEEKKSLMIKDNGSYTELATSVIPHGNQLEPQVRLGKVRLGKDKEEQEATVERLPVVLKVAYGEFGNVKLTEEERSKLIEKLGIRQTLDLIEELSGYLASKGKKYSSHYATILNWSRRKSQEINSKGKSVSVIN